VPTAQSLQTALDDAVGGVDWYSPGSHVSVTLQNTLPASSWYCVGTLQGPQTLFVVELGWFTSCCPTPHACHGEHTPGLVPPQAVVAYEPYGQGTQNMHTPDVELLLLLLPKVPAGHDVTHCPPVKNLPVGQVRQDEAPCA